MNEPVYMMTQDEAEESRKARAARANLSSVVRRSNGHKDRYVFEIAREYKHPDEVTADLKAFTSIITTRIKGMN